MSDTRTRLETVRKHCILHLVCELEHTVHVGLALLPFSTSALNSSSIVYLPQRNAFTLSSLIGKHALTDFSPVQSSRWVLRSTNIWLTLVSPYQRSRTACAPSVFSRWPR